jgi:hypothetical protein
VAHWLLSPSMCARCLNQVTLDRTAGFRSAPTVLRISRSEANPHFSMPSLSHEAAGFCSLLRSAAPLLRQESVLASVVPQEPKQLRLGCHLVPKPSHRLGSFSRGPRRAIFLSLNCIVVDRRVRPCNCPPSPLQASP